MVELHLGLVFSLDYRDERWLLGDVSHPSLGNIYLKWTTFKFIIFTFIVVNNEH
ncbi:MAG: hypothetical protein ACTSVI_11215 [Promethearchaeota archaeon]